jgi:hypothetical protein
MRRRLLRTRKDGANVRYATFFIITALLLAGAFAANALAANPGFSKSTAIAVSFGSSGTIDSSLSTTLDRHPKCGSPDGNGHVVWFTATAPTTGTVTADTLGSVYDTVLTVYERGKFVACNDDASGLPGRVSQVTFNVVAGKKYYFQVAAFSTVDGGSTVLNLTGVTAP